MVRGIQVIKELEYEKAEWDKQQKEAMKRTGG